MRLIDADALKTRIIETRDKLLIEKRYGWEYEYTGMNRAILLVGAEVIRHRIDAPTIDLVRCRECKYYIRDEENDDDYCGIHSIGIYADDFCSYGKRNDDEKA